MTNELPERLPNDMTQAILALLDHGVEVNFTKYMNIANTVNIRMTAFVGPDGTGKMLNTSMAISRSSIATGYVNLMLYTLDTMWYKMRRELINQRRQLEIKRVDATL